MSLTVQNVALPTKKNESWKYTNLEKYWPDFDLSEQGPFEHQLSERSDQFHHLVFLNGEFNQELSDLKIERLEKDNAAGFSKIKQRLEGVLSNEAVFQLIERDKSNQYLLELEGVSPRPIFLHHVYSADKAKHSSAHLQVVAKPNSETCIFESHQQISEDANFINNATSFIIEDNAKTVFVKTQGLNDQSSLIQNTRALVLRDARFESFTIDAGGALCRNNISIKLDQEGASCAAHGLYMLNGEQHCDTNSFIHHASPHTESSQLYKGIMSDKSHGIFTGLIRVEKDAQLIVSEQLNKNLLLSKGAHAHSRPQLEIYADDVKCAHGSTTGQLSDEEIFYFETRGVSRDKAQKLLAQAFAFDVLLKIKNPILRQSAQDLVKSAFKALNAE